MLTKAEIANYSKVLVEALALDTATLKSLVQLMKGWVLYSTGLLLLEKEFLWKGNAYLSLAGLLASERACRVVGMLCNKK